jgi:hypothetical protein
MDIVLDKIVRAVDYNDTDIDIVEYNGDIVWRKEVNIALLETYTIGQLETWTINEMEGN